MRILVLALIASLTVACRDGVLIPAVPNADGAMTEIFVVGIEGEEAPETIFVADLSSPSSPLRFELPREPRRLEAFLLKRTVEELGLEPGAQRLLEGAPPERFDAWSAETRPGQRAEWSREEAPQWLGAVRIPPVDRAACLERGACLVDGECRADCGAIDAPAPPQPVIPPGGACAAGWAVVQVEGGAVCSPFETVHDCADDALQLPGRAGCEPVGQPCGPLEFPGGEGGEVLYRVAPRGSDTGDGSAGAPFATLAGALERVPDGAHIVVAAGDYGALSIDRAVRITGACPRAVSVGSVEVSAMAEIEDVTIDALTVRGDATVRGVVVRGTETAVRVEDGASLEIDRLAVSAGHRTGLSVAAEGSVRGTGLVVRGTTVALQTLGDVTLADVVVHGPDGAIRILGGRTQVARLVVLSNAEFSVEDATVVIQDALIRESSLVGIDLVDAAASFSNVWIDAPFDGAVAMADTTATFEDVVMSDVDRDAALVANRSTLALVRVLVLRAAQMGILIRTSTVTIEDLAVHHVGAPGESSEQGLLIRNSTLGDARRLSFSDIGDSAFHLDNVVATTVSDVRVVGGDRGRCHECAGICLRRNASPTFMRVELVDVEGTGVWIDQNEAEFFDVRVVRPGRNRACEITSGPAGLGIGFVNDNAAATFVRFLVEEPGYAGARILGTQGFLRSPRLEHGVVRGARVGIEVGVVDFASQIDRVDLSENGRPILQARMD